MEQDWEKSCDIRGVMHGRSHDQNETLNFSATSWYILVQSTPVWPVVRIANSLFAIFSKNIIWNLNKNSVISRKLCNNQKFVKSYILALLKFPLIPHDVRPSMWAFLYCFKLWKLDGLVISHLNFNSRHHHKCKGYIKTFPFRWFAPRWSLELHLLSLTVHNHIQRKETRSLDNWEKGNNWFSILLHNLCLNNPDVRRNHFL